ncbi:MAG: AAA family ATPase [Elusimicrobia bacterium]|nr:AAA family ATPase [Elusimicrobiota bacterium]
MASLRNTKALKSVVAVIVSGALMVTTAVTPVAAQTFRAGQAAEAGQAARANFAPTTLGGVSALPTNLSLGSANLVPAIGNATESPAAAPTALALPRPAAANADERQGAQQPAKTPSAPIEPASQAPAPKKDDGPRWVGNSKQPAPPAAGPRWVKTDKKTAADAGPRWVGPKKSGVRAALAKYLPFLGRSGQEIFDGAANRKDGVTDAPAAAKGHGHSHASGLSKASARSNAIINDYSIPTPEAARRVGEIREKQGTPLWAKIVAPLSVIAAVAVAVSYGAVPVLTLGVGLVVSVLAHEVAHIAVLHRLGDKTAEHAHSHSLNPFVHIDAVKTVIVPALSLAISSVLLPFPILLGAGKPVDADFNNLTSPFGGPRSARNAFWVAAAGPATNLLIAGLAFGAAALLPAGGVLALVAAGLWKMNLALAAFNMLPLPQLDGGKILASVLPERFYAKWIFNPKVERGYQGMYRRLYEGPANVLTWLADFMGVRTQKGINTLANTVTFTALAAFYAAAYFNFALALPLLFLALPCSYDYWCIREKVRSEAAVQDLMELMSQWSAVIVQIAEDLGLESEVSAYETEHAMKNALETLVDEMMAKEEFRALSDDQKLEALMKEYPDKAAEFLKEKAMPEDSLEKIKAVLADPRNAPFYERLRKWFKEHEIFSRWDNKHQQGKLKDAMKAADKEKSQGGGAVKPSLLSRLLSAPSIGDAPADARPDPMDKVTPDPDLSRNSVVVTLAEGATEADVQRVFEGLVPVAGAEPRTYRATLAMASDIHLLARRIARDASVASMLVNPELRNAMVLPRAEPVSTNPAVRAASWTEKVKLNSGYPQARVRAVYANHPAAMRAFRALSSPKEMKGQTVVETTLRSAAEAAELARALADEAEVKTVVVSRFVHNLLLTRGRTPAAEAPAAEEPAADPAQVELPLEPAAQAPAPAVPAAVPALIEGEHPFAPARAPGAGKAVTSDDSLPGHVLVVEFSDPMTDEQYGEFMSDMSEDLPGLRSRETISDRHGMGFIASTKLTFQSDEDAARAARVFRAVPATRAIRAHRAVVAYFGDASDAEALSKIRGDNPTYTKVEAVFHAVDEAAARAFIHALGHDSVSVSHDGMGRIVYELLMESAAVADMAMRVARSAFTLSVSVNQDAMAALSARAAAAAAAVAPEPVVEPAPAPPAKPTLPAKVTTHGKAEFAVNALLVKFVEGTSEADIRAALARHGQSAVYRHGDMYTIVAPGSQSALDMAPEVAAEASVEAVKVHPNVAAKMTEDAEPYPDAQTYDHQRAILVDFREGATEESIKDYAEVRRLKLVNPNFRGSERSALLEVPQGADMAVTLQMLVDETAAPHSGASSIRPFQEQPGAPELKPSAAAVAAAEPEPVAPVVARRDPAQAWQEYLQNVTLSDGKSKLTDKQVQLLSVMLKPLARNPEDKRPPVVGRGDEIKRMLPIVTSPRGMRNSVILIGEAGVGKTAVPEGLAEMIEDAEAATAADSQAFLQFERLKGRWLVELDINKILTQDDPVGMLSAILDLLPRLNKGNASRGNDIIVLMDEIQKFFLDNSGQKIANVLKGPLRDGKISVIATTTRSEFKKFIEGDDAFRRRFEKIDVEEPTVAQTTSILRAMKSWLQALHDAVIPDQALVDAAKLTDQFDKTNFNPDKSIKAVQDAAELSRPDNLRAAITLDLRETWGELVVAVNEARQALIDKGIASTLALPVDMYNKVAGLVKKAESLYAERDAVAGGSGKVTTEVVKRVIAAKTGIASGQLNLGEDDAARYTKMEEEIGKRVVNQGPALTAIANAVRRNKAGLSNPNRPMGKFLLTGPTGVSKTYLAKELARFLFNDPEAMVRMDMSEYMEEHTAQRLTGSPPGYVGYGEGGQLTEAVRKKPYSVLLFDEVEKAHPKVFDVLLQILDDGRLTDGQGRTVDFKNTVIIMTSNSGMSGVDGEKYAKMLARIEEHNAAVAAGKPVDPSAKPLPTVEEVNKLWDEEIDLMVGAALKERFRPEFLNRLDEDPLSKNKWIRVNRLRPQDIALIAKIQLKEFQQLLSDRHDTDISFDQSVIDFLAVDGYSPLYGARPMTAAIEKNIIDPMAQWILKEAEAGKNDVRGAAIKVTYAGGKITFEASKKPEKNTARTTVQGASEAVAAELFSLIERLSGGVDAEEPSENLFDQLMRKALPPKETASAASASTAGERTKAFLAPGAGLSVNSAAVVAEHNNSKKKDAATRAITAEVIASVKAAGWDESVIQALDTPASGQGEGWLKQVVKLAKEQATKAGVPAPVTVTAKVDADAIRVAVAGAYELSADDQKSLVMHFSGAAPESYLAAQQKADNLNLSARLLWDHNLLDLYRRLAAIPGARMGFKTGPEGTQIWLEIRKETPALSAGAKVAAAVSDAPAAKGTPHQIREMAKTRELMMRVIDQSRISENQRDGHAIRIAAAEGYAMLAQPSDAATARGWIEAKKWGTDALEAPAENTWSSPKVTNEVGADWPLAMTAALILERFGGAEDVQVLENMARRVTGTSHYEVPVHNALVQALSAIYARLGLAATREAMHRAAQIKGGRTTDITDAANRALGAIGMPADLDHAKTDADSYLALMKRLGRTEELQRIFRDTTFRGTNSAEPVRQAALKLAGETETSPEALARLHNMMKTQTSYSRTGYEMSRAWAAMVSRLGLTIGLGDAMKRYLDARGVKDYSLGSSWPILYAYVVTAQLSGGADTLAPLEELMDQSPGDIASVNEQAYFNSPDAWARVLVRSGKFEEYSRSQGLNADGSPKPSKLQEMLTNQTRPMKTAAALRAIAYARDPFFSRRAAEPKGSVPDIHPGSTSSAAPSSSPSFPRGPSNPRFRDDWPPRHDMF